MAALRLAARSRLIQGLRTDVFRSAQRNASTSSVRPTNPLRTALYAGVFAVSTGLLAVYYFDSRSSIHRYVLTPLVRNLLDPEQGHQLAVKALRSGLAARDTQPDDELLKCELWEGITTTNPVGVAAGFDKNGEAIDGLFNLGFNWVEIGSVTPKPQPGNPRPRMFRLTADGAVINRYGFPSEGHAVVLSRLKSRIPWFFKEGHLPASFKPGKLLAVNLGKNKTSPPDSIDDFVTGVHTFAPYADVLVVNVSSPNTPGLRSVRNPLFYPTTLSFM
ncbi:hypothetical protein NM688_g9153 [Phlebia brevispora]|uniref:Uncharacterized protein n=1 Tax=Phlebia brevispora TaxID=194682 RepID=A0ACC1RKC3_9APHY|nr:hypothetical protein NM688_g9153 [Phlebia brevispora]